MQQNDLQKKKLTLAQLELWLSDPVTKAMIDCLSIDDIELMEAIGSGHVGSPDNAHLTQAAYYENLGIRQGLARAGNVEFLIRKHYEIEGEKGEEDGK